MKIELLGWKSEGLRSPDIEVNLERSDTSVARVSLLQMPNGTGKTTSLNCLRAAMDGSAETWPEAEVISYKPTDAANDQGSFIATLRVDGDQKIIIEMTFHFNEGVVTYKTTVGSKTEDNYRPPPEVRRYLDPRFSKLLFFDGELANNLIAGKGTTSASQIIDTFYGLYHLTELKENARSSYESYEKMAGPAKGASQIAKANRKRESLRAKRDALKEQLTQNEARETTLREETARVEEELEEHLLRSDQFREEETRARDEREKASERLEKAFHEIDKIFPDPFALWPPLAAQVQDLVENVDRLGLANQPPQSFLKQLLHEPTCVCDRPMDAEAQSSIKRKSDGVLGDDISGYLMTLTRRTKAYGSDGIGSFREAMNEIISADNTLTDAGKALENIRNRAEETGDKEVTRKKDALDRLEAEIDEIERSIEEANRPTRQGDDERCGCLDYFEKRLKDMEDQLAILSGTLDRKHRTDALIDVIDSAYKKAHSVLKDEVVTRANERLRQILRYNPVQIKDISSSVILDGRGGASVGQTLAVGYVFLAGLLHEGGNQFPLVVDSPVGSLDDEARRELGGLLPILVKQMIGFVIATERKWFVEPLEEASDGEMLFLTHLRINDYTKEIISELGGNTRSKSENGILLEGRSAFMALGESVGEAD